MLVLLVAVFLVLLCAVAWAFIARRLWTGAPLVPLAARRPVPWRGVDLFVIAVFYLVASLAWVLVLPRPAAAADERIQKEVLPRPAATVRNPRDLAVALAASMAVNLTTVAFAVLWIGSCTEATWQDIGWWADRVRDDLRTGLVGFLAIAAPIYGLQWLLSQFVKEQHPIIEVLRRQPSALLYLLAGLSAVAIAPLAEELFFRVLLQGWLEAIWTPAGVAAREPAVTGEAGPPRSAIVITSVLFAAMHIGHGAAPVPIFFLALALGYLYQRTHRLLPSLTVHFCLNACSFAMLWLAPPDAG